jgi:hypothetical protein
VGTRLLAALAAFLLMAGFVTACGGDDDDDDAASEEDVEETTEETDPPYDDAAMSGATLAFCEDWISSDDEEILIEDVQASADLALAAVSELPTDVGEATQAAADFAQSVVDNDDGDGIASPDELQAALDAFPAFEEGIPLIDEHCAPAQG